MRPLLRTTSRKPRLEVMPLESRNTPGEALSYLLGWGPFTDVLVDARFDPAPITQAAPRESVAATGRPATPPDGVVVLAPAETGPGASPPERHPATGARSGQASPVDLDVSFWVAVDDRPASEPLPPPTGSGEPRDAARVGPGAGEVGAGSPLGAAPLTVSDDPVMVGPPAVAGGTTSATDALAPISLNASDDDNVVARPVSASYETTLIPVNANNDNGSPWKSAALPFIPNTRDFAATNLPVDDPQLKLVTVNIGPGAAGTLYVSSYAPGEATVAFWADKRKQAAFSSKAVAATTPVTVIFYVEGTHESAYDGDVVRIDLKFITANPPATTVRSDTVRVAPFINTVQSFTSKIPNPSVYFTDWLPNNGFLGLSSGQPPAQLGARAAVGIEFDAEITNGPLTMKYMQDLRDLRNGANGSGAGAVFTAASGLANQNLLPNVGSGLTYPALDSLDPADPTADADSTSTPTATGVKIYTADAPATGRPANADKLDKLDLKYLFRTYIVVQYADKSLYPIAYWDWNVNFFATTNAPQQGVTVIAVASKVSTEGGWVKSNADPLKTAGPIVNGNVGWR